MCWLRAAPESTTPEVHMLPKQIFIHEIKQAITEHHCNHYHLKSGQNNFSRAPHPDSC
jgi:hypothetical protein